jgi:transcriptional regulator with XRE-family HTH domain
MLVRRWAEVILKVAGFSYGVINTLYHSNYIRRERQCNAISFEKSAISSARTASPDKAENSPGENLLTVVSCGDTLYRMNEHKIGINIRRLRSRAGLTLTLAAGKADITKSTLSKIETGQISAPISTLIRIAKAVNVPLVEFFVDDRKQPAYVLTPKGKGQIVSRDGSQFGYSYESLALEKGDKYVEPFLLTINPGDPTGQFHHGGQEFIYMLSGAMEFTIGTEKMKLKAGDSLYFDSALVHKTHVLGSHPAKFVCVFVQEKEARTRKEKTR